MTPFSYKKFKEAGFTIPNSNPAELEIIDSKYIHPFDNREYKTKEIHFKGEHIVSFTSGYWYPDVVYENREVAIKLGILSLQANSYGILDSIVDSLYYHYNPVSFTKGKGVIKVAAIKALFRRFADSSYINSVVTNNILDIYKKAVENKLLLQGLIPNSIEFNLAQQEELVANGLNSRINVCCLTGKYGRDSFFRTYIYENKQVKVHQETDVSKYHLQVDNRFLLHPNQYVWNNKIYNEEDGACKCPECGEKVPKLAYNKETKQCIRCETRHYEIHSYSTKVPQLLKFKATKVKPETVYMGCELEFETTDKDSARLKVGRALKGHAIMKSDGSIRNGFEVVTCPATLDIHMEVFKQFYGDLPSELRNAPNVGMHVHVSRKPLSILQVGKLTAFMNNYKNKKFIEYVAGRNNNSYCTQDLSRTVTYPWTHTSGGARYNTLNLCNKETVEFRIFSTPMTFQDFASKMQFCQALVDYCKPANLSLALKEVVDYNNFIKWVSPLKKDYPQLVETLKGFA